MVEDKESFPEGDANAEEPAKSASPSPPPRSLPPSESF
jgi:hypothetical protein